MVSWTQSMAVTARDEAAKLQIVAALGQRRGREGRCPRAVEIDMELLQDGSAARRCVDGPVVSWTQSMAVTARDEAAKLQCYPTSRR
jgi:hypothetical protein